jgi:EVE domain
MPICRSKRSVSDGTTIGSPRARGLQQARVGAVRYVSLMGTRRHWVIVASRDHARRGVGAGFVMANHGKRSPLARMAPGDSVLIYSPTTTYPRGEPLRAVTIVGEVTGEGPEPSDVIPNGFRRAARLCEIDPLSLDAIREHLPVSRIRFGFFELDAADAEAIWTLVEHRRR